MNYKFNDGGRSRYFKAGNVGDCVTRAIAIASGKDYKEIYDLIQKTTGKSPRNGVFTKTKAFKDMMSKLGFVWTSCMSIGAGCKVHLAADELPSGRLVCCVSKHFAAVIDGTLEDTYDCTRDGKRCVYGYYTFIG